MKGSIAFHHSASHGEVPILGATAAGLSGSACFENTAGQASSGTQPIISIEYLPNKAG